LAAVHPQPEGRRKTGDIRVTGLRDSYCSDPTAGTWYRGFRIPSLSMETDPHPGVAADLPVRKAIPTGLDHLDLEPPGPQEVAERA